MKNIIEKLDRLLENRIRLGIMSALMVNKTIDYISLKELLNVTDGNLASHLKALEKHKLISVRKQFVGRKPKTSYSATRHGKEIFNKHLAALEELIKNS